MRRQQARCQVHSAGCCGAAASELLPCYPCHSPPPRPGAACKQPQFSGGYVNNYPAGFREAKFCLAPWGYGFGEWAGRLAVVGWARVCVAHLSRLAAAADAVQACGCISRSWAAVCRW